MQHYIYDGSGERVLKANSDMEAVYENGELVNTPGTVSINGYTSYPSAFMVITADGVYSKHYYAGTQRIVSRLGDNDASIFESGCVGCKQEPSATPFDDNKLKQAQILDLNVFVEKGKKGKVTLKEYKPISIEEQEKAMATEDSKEIERAPSVTPIYYYHPDHLGTSSALTDFNGNAYQFFLNLPFGETMAQQLGSNYYNSPFKFNGKELDEETGFYYYGARYYDPKISIWLSTDPLAEKFPNFNPYNYVMQNPLNLIDPTGMSPEEGGGDSEGNWYRTGKGRNVTYTYVTSANQKSFLSENKKAYKLNSERDVFGVNGTSRFTLKKDGSFVVKNKGESVSGHVKWNMKLKNGGDFELRARDYQGGGNFDFSIGLNEGAGLEVKLSKAASAGFKVDSGRFLGYHYNNDTGHEEQTSQNSDRTIVGANLGNGWIGGTVSIVHEPNGTNRTDAGIGLFGIFGVSAQFYSDGTVKYDYGIDINPGVHILVIGADLSLKAGGKGCTRF